MRDGRTVAVSAMADITKLELVRTMLGKELTAVHGQGARSRDGRPIGRAVGRGRRTCRSGVRVRDVSLTDRPGRDRRPRRPARLRPHRDRAAVFGADRATAARSRSSGETRSYRGAGRRDRRRHRLRLRGPQGRGHRPRYVRAREPDAGAPAAPARNRASSTDAAPAARSSSASSRRSASNAPRRSSRSANSPAATSRRCCSRAGCA